MTLLSIQISWEGKIGWRLAGREQENVIYKLHKELVIGIQLINVTIVDVMPTEGPFSPS